MKKIIFYNVIKHVMCICNMMFQKGINMPVYLVDWFTASVWTIYDVTKCKNNSNEIRKGVSNIKTSALTETSWINRITQTKPYDSSAQQRLNKWCFCSVKSKQIKYIYIQYDI